MASAHSSTEQNKVEGAKGERGCQGELEGVESSAMLSPSNMDRQGCVVEEGTHGTMHGSHVVNSSNTWRVMEWPVWDVFLSQLWAKFDLWTKSKVEAHELLYNIYLGAMVIGAVD